MALEALAVTEGCRRLPCGVRASMLCCLLKLIVLQRLHLICRLPLPMANSLLQVLQRRYIDSPVIRRGVMLHSTTPSHEATCFRP